MLWENLVISENKQKVIMKKKLQIIEAKGRILLDQNKFAKYQ